MKETHIFHSGRFRVFTVPDEKKMSHWVNAPVVVDCDTGKDVVDLRFGRWDLRDVVETDEGLDMTLSPYPPTVESR